MRDRDKYKVLAEKDQQLWPRYRKLRNGVTAELRKSVKTYYQGLIDETSNNPKEMWKSVKIDENLVKREINRRKCSKSPGHDQIPVKVIKDAVEIVSKPLAKIFNSSMEEGIFPDIWKLAMVTPIFKKGKNLTCVTTGQFLYFQYCQNCSRKLFMTKFRRL